MQFAQVWHFEIDTKFDTKFVTNFSGCYLFLGIKKYSLWCKLGRMMGMPYCEVIQMVQLSVCNFG